MTSAVPKIEQLARELWEAYATRNQTVINLPTLHWDELDEFGQDTWRLLARVATVFTSDSNNR